MPLTSNYNRVWRKRAHVSRERSDWNALLGRLRAMQRSEQPTATPTRRPAIVFDSSNIATDGYRPQGYGLFYCVHGKPYIHECHACKRDKHEAGQHAARLYARIRQVILADWEVT